MKIGDSVFTPRFCMVRIKEIFENREAAYEAGYTEPTYYEDDEYGITGKVTSYNHMVFAAIKK